VREVALLEPVHRLAVVIFRDSVRTFADGDCELAQMLKLKDRELDAVTRDVSEKLVARATMDSCQATWTLSLLLVPWSGSAIMLRTSLRILSGVTKLATFVIPTVQKKNIRRVHLSLIGLVSRF